MDLHSFCQFLGYTPKEESVIASIYTELQEKCTEDFPSFLEKETLQRHVLLVTDDAEITQRLLSVSDMVRHSPPLCFYANALYYGVFVRSGAFHPMFYMLPPAETPLGDNAGIFYLAIALAVFPQAKDAFDKLGIPEKYVRDIGKWLAGAIQIHRTGHDGLPGLNIRQLHWLGHSAKARLFRIGRLEFELTTYPAWCPAAYKNRYTGELCLLSREGISYTPEGRRPINGDDDTSFFHATLAITETSVTGYRINPVGYLEMEQPCTLELTDWEPVVTPWDLSPCVHIPAGGGLTPEAVKTSLTEAVQFFPKYLHKPVKCFITNSWIFHYTWDNELPDSNIVKCGREGYRFPAFPLHPKSGLFFVFGRDDGEPLTYPQHTSLEKAFHRVLASGRPLGDSGWFYLAADVDKYGTTPYRKQ